MHNNMFSDILQAFWDSEVLWGCPQNKHHGA